MKEIKIALLQIMPGNNIDENLEIGIRACRKAKKDGADMWYICRSSKDHRNVIVITGVLSYKIFKGMI